MRNLMDERVNRYRLRTGAVLEQWGSFGDGTCGAFLVPSCIDGAGLAVVASSGEGWDHVSVSRKNRCPNWAEMEQVKRLFFEDNETAMQLHVPATDHINQMPTCLHLWRPLRGRIPRPPARLVGSERRTEDAG